MLRVKWVRRSIRQGARVAKACVEYRFPASQERRGTPPSWPLDLAGGCSPLCQLVLKAFQGVTA
jgi:hypothetical protein